MLVFIITATLGTCVYPDSYTTSCTSVEIPKTTTTLGHNIFKGHTNLTTITFEKPSTLKTIGNDFCHGCNNLTSITNPPTLTSIGDRFCAFCTSIESLALTITTTIGENFCYTCTELKTLTINAAITLGDQFCGYCTSLNKFKIPATVTSIESIGVGDHYNFSVCFENSSTNINITGTTGWATIVLTRPFIPTNPISTTRSAYIINPDSTDVTVGITVSNATYNSTIINVLNQNITNETDWWKTLCDMHPNNDDSSDNSSVAIIVGSIFGSLALIAIIILSVLFL